MMVLCQKLVVSLFFVAEHPIRVPMASMSLRILWKMSMETRREFCHMGGSCLSRIVFLMENPMKVDDVKGTTISGNPHVAIKLD